MSEKVGFFQKLELERQKRKENEDIRGIDGLNVFLMTVIETTKISQSNNPSLNKLQGSRVFSHHTFHVGQFAMIIRNEISESDNFDQILRKPFHW